MAPEQFDPLAVLQHEPWFSGLPSDLQDRMLRMSSLKHAKAGTRLFSKGDVTSGLYALLEGTVWVVNEMEPGQDGTLTHLHRPAWFGEVGLFDGLCRTHNVEAGSDCTLLFLPHGPLTRMLDHHPHYWKCFSLLLTQKLRLAFLALDELARASVDARLARRLIFMSMDMGSNQPTRQTIEVPQEHLAQMMGMSRTSINPLLRRLSERGVIRLSYGKVHILDMAELKRLAGHDHMLPTAGPPRGCKTP